MNPHGIVILNEQAVHDKQRDPLFYENDLVSTNQYVLTDQLRTHVPKPEQKPNTLMISSDPRLYHSARFQYIPLDREPTNAYVPLRQIYDEDLRHYGENLPGKSYEHIKEGDVTYYLSNYFRTPTIPVNFVTQTPVKAFLFRDPNNSTYPMFVKDETMDQCDFVPHENSLSFIKDTINHREDLMNRQMQPMLRVNYNLVHEFLK